MSTDSVSDTASAASATELAASAVDARLRALLPRLVATAQAAERVAIGSCGKLRTLVLLGLLAALWLAWRSMLGFELSTLSTALILLVLSLPVLALARLQRMLAAVIGLPQRLQRTCADVQAAVAAMPDKVGVAPLKQEAQRVGRLRALLGFGRTLLELRALGGRARSVALAAGGAVAVANPVFVFALVACTLLVVGLIALAMLSLLLLLW